MPKRYRGTVNISSKNISETNNQSAINLTLDKKIKPTDILINPSINQKSESKQVDTTESKQVDTKESKQVDTKESKQVDTKESKQVDTTESKQMARKPGLSIEPVRMNAEPEFHGKKIKLDLVIGYLVNKTKKSFEDEFKHVFEKLLEKISEDYEIPLEELKENYQLECDFYNKKPRDPANMCQAICKNGNPCSKNKRNGYEYCGVHLNMALKENKIISNSPLIPLSKTYDDDKTTTLDLTTNDEKVDLEEFEYEGETYLKLGSVIYEYPEELDENTELADLIAIGNLDENDEIVFRNK